MTEQTNPTAGSNQPEFAMSRTFDAPRDLVFKAWTEPERLAQWWGPKGFAIRVAEFDLRPGGTFLYCMTVPNGGDMWGKLVYREVLPPERLAFVVSFCDEAGKITRHPASATWPLEVLSTVTFSEYEGKTTLVSRTWPINAEETELRTFEGGIEGMRAGLTGSLNQLAEYLAEAGK